MKPYYEQDGEVNGEREAVRRLGERIGYGNMMQLASELWHELEPGGAFQVGPCFATPCRCGHPSRSHDEESGHRCVECACKYFRETP
jgi:hypothetical protein